MRNSDKFPKEFFEFHEAGERLLFCMFYPNKKYQKYPLLQQQVKDKRSENSRHYSI